MAKAIAEHSGYAAGLRVQVSKRGQYNLNIFFKGYYPSNVGLQHLKIHLSQPAGIYTQFKLLPEYLKELGYRTAMVGK